MFFDDRLATVLRQSADGDRAKRTQFRQLLDILGSDPRGIGRSGEGVSRDYSLIASAWLRMDALGGAIPSEDRARMIREPGWRFRNPELAAHLADFEPEVAAAALGRAQLSSEDWTALIPRLPVRARGFLRLRRDLPVDVEDLLDQLGVSDRGLPSPEAEVLADGETLELVEEADAEFATPPPSPYPGIDEDKRPPHDIEPGTESGDDDSDDKLFDPTSAGRSEISALVERIAQFKRKRDHPAELDVNEPRLPLGEDTPREARLISAFGFSADAGGRIEWADGDAAPMVIGTRLTDPPRIGSAASESALERAFSRRQPVVGEAITLDGAEAIAGEWFVHADPRFTDDGNFAGYVGRFRRPAGPDDGPTAAQREADRIRQLLHELRTPVTAVQGYAEVIQQQLFGSAPHEYRALAAAIAADAARILSGFEELDRLAKLETGVIEMETGETDLASLAQRTANQLAQVLAPRMAGIEIEDPEAHGSAGSHIVELDPDNAEALMWRLLATLGGGCGSGEMLGCSVSSNGSFAVLTCELPAQLLAEEDIFTAEAKPIGDAVNAGLFGAGFALRLARAEARAVGGDLVRDGERLVLTLPLYDDEDEDELRRDV